MKVHLFRPGEVITLCGIQIKSFSTSEPWRVTCKRCWGAYEDNVVWYWAGMHKIRPAGLRWSQKDSPISGINRLIARAEVEKEWKAKSRQLSLPFLLGSASEESVM